MEEIKSATKAIKYILKNDGVFIIQFLYLKNIIEKKYFDQFYHEHLNYYNLKPLNNFLNSYNLQIFDVEKSQIHGGSIIAYVCHSGLRKRSKRFLDYLELEDKENANKLFFYSKFSHQIYELKSRFNKKMDYFKKRNFNIYGIGAPAKSSTLISYFGISKKDIKFTLENNPLKFNRYLPISHIKILSEKKFRKNIDYNKDVFLIFSWNFKKNIISKYKKKFKKNFRYFLPY